MCAVLLMFAVFVYRGQSHDAKSHVKAFMEESMGLEDYDVLAWSNVDSTFRVTDSMLTVMHTTAAKEKIVKPNASYVKRTDKLNLITIKYVSGKDTLMNTFYLDDKLQGVVGVKQDVFGVK